MELKEYLLNNLDILQDIVMELNSYNNCLDFLDYQENSDEFFNTFFTDKMEVARAVCYGDYNYTDDYVKFDAYGNLETCEHWQLENELQEYIDEIIDNLLEYKDNIYIYDDKLKELLDNE